MKKRAASKPKPRTYPEEPAEVELPTAEEVRGILSDDPAMVDDGKVPIAEAMASAMAMQAHQHAAATPEDAPATPGRLPFPRPPFDEARALAAINEQRAVVRDMAAAVYVAEGAEKAAKARHKSAIEDHDEARSTFEALWDAFMERKTEEAAGEQLNFTHGAECAWERANPGRVCAVCSAERDVVRHAGTNGGGAPVSQPAGSLGTDAVSTAAAAAPPQHDGDEAPGAEATA